MSEIIYSNFYDELPVIESMLRSSAFVCIDMEFSKLHDDNAVPFTFFDTLEDRYQKLRLKVSDITCIQLGLSFFIYDVKHKTFDASSYSFYTFPQSYLKYDNIIKFQTSCVEFLCRHKFDFNKLFHHSIPYLTNTQEIDIQVLISDDNILDDHFKNNVFRSVKEELIEQLKSVNEWYDGAKEGDYLLLKKYECNSPLFTYLLLHYIKKKHQNVCLKEEHQYINITKMSFSEKSFQKNDAYYKKKFYTKILGIKYLLNLLSELKKPLIGHNCAMDILILCNQFFKPLPNNLKDYQSFVSNTFGPIYDTKLMCKEFRRLLPKNVNWDGSSLSEIYLFLKDGDAKIYSDSLFIKQSTEEFEDLKLHHAGWDAYYTGYCFIKIVYITKNFSSNTQNVNRMYTLIELFKSVESLKNKVFTSRLMTNCIDLHCHNSIYNQPECLVIKSKGLFSMALNLNEE
ncbi:pre-piRNA 3'-exonuclease trimmer-like isoform X2 [Daktulosphaira vitifoliae]|uniref:pre-piRNA 3'-exonuclease trimmer-like isoform X2 n=1 Tax=Daktulosphaira vitifoliae TaxID=58002 RepID=UPI0021AABD80|nr:pre-piRNA 3'-exonuclease trimmer-like isoform X2 [Daktulosphaira vitifoliae]